ncbi:hypothetical protein NA66_10027 [Burkholderia pyrrocinia]|uniref:Uncharacterized protein n=1 Tax=Burkholderia pyrrocinia TaxID=60550 RepID=A0A318IY52_BURPY|nr:MULTISPECIES: hypothetical protein [Burkholderia]PXX38897.1 hypothetical protein NA66_10027 [Burkholderia pyrrocinia]SFW90775.1 hypothetical protein SAMN03159384_07096 [Burkholderia sp. NFACC33-1]SFY46539.1 hypothetical protein SAMN03159408_07079 [Burkholderia sp. NFPP32]
MISAGTQGHAEAINPERSGNTIVNNGLIQGVNSAAIWFQNRSGLNTVINNETGVTQAPNNVIGSSGNGAVDFTNRGKVIGNLVFAGGDDSLHLYTGSVITATSTAAATTSSRSTVLARHRYPAASRISSRCTKPTVAPGR